MTIVDHPLGKEWLSQFDTTDQPLARLLLRTLKLVSFDEMEGTIRGLLNRLAAEVDGQIGLFPVTEGHRGRRPHWDSSDRIGHLVEGLERENRRRFRVSPTDPGMRSERTKHIVLVDDLIGTGRRILTYWRTHISRTLKSWLSYGVCKLWIVAYTGHPLGLSQLTRRISYVQDAVFRLGLRLPQTPGGWNNHIVSLCQEYASRTDKPGAALGFGSCMVPIVFQYGCPNNAPAILWSKGRTWKAIFPNRSVPEGAYDLFVGLQDLSRQPELLANSGQYALAIEMLKRIDDRTLANGDSKILTTLGLLLRGRRIDDLPTLTMSTQWEVNNVIQNAKGMLLLEGSGRVTEFGKDIVNRFRYGETSRDVCTEGLENREPYFPKQFSLGR